MGKKRVAFTTFIPHEPKLQFLYRHRRKRSREANWRAAAAAPCMLHALMLQFSRQKLAGDLTTMAFLDFQVCMVDVFEVSGL